MSLLGTACLPLCQNLPARASCRGSKLVQHQPFVQKYQDLHGSVVYLLVNINHACFKKLGSDRAICSALCSRSAKLRELLKMTKLVIPPQQAHLGRGIVISDTELIDTFICGPADPPCWSSGKWYMSLLMAALQPHLPFLNNW